MNRSRPKVCEIAADNVIDMQERNGKTRFHRPTTSGGILATAKRTFGAAVTNPGSIYKGGEINV